MRGTARDAISRAFHILARGTVTKANDKPQLQELEIELLYGEKKTNVEHWHPYGISFVPLPPKKKRYAEAIVAFLGGNRDHAVVIGVADRRFRVRGLKEGEFVIHDDQGHQVHFTRGGIVVSAPQGKKIVTQIMKENDPPKADDSGQQQQMANANEGMGTPTADPDKLQGPQADPKNKVHATFTLDKDSFTLSHPSKIVHQIADADGSNVKASITFEPGKITHKADAIVTSGKTFTVGVTQMAEVDGPSQHWQGPLGT